MKKLNHYRVVLTACFTAFAAFLVFKVLADPPQPVISIQSQGTNVFSIIVTNGVGTGNYDLYWTPVLANPDYPWTVAAVGNPGQTNFLLDITPYSVGFFRVLLEGTNGIPPWKMADPNDPNSGVLTVFIDSPANNSVVSQ